jgi:hypothetical protein
LSCFNESFNHFMKSGDGATGVSSALGGGVAFAGGTGERALEVVPDPLDGAAIDPVEEGVIGRRPTEGVAIGIAVVFPLEPTVVHAPPVDRVAGVAYTQDIPSEWLIHRTGIAQTLFVVSAYARRAAADATDSLEAAFFLLSSSSRMSLIDFLVAGFCALVQTATGGVDWASTADETVADMEEDAEGTTPPTASLDGVFAPTWDVGRPQEAVKGWESSEGETAAVARARSRSAAFRASCFLASISCISRKLVGPPVLLFLSSSVDQTGLVGAETVDEEGVGSFMG